MTATSIELVQTFDCRECRRAKSVKCEGAFGDVFEIRCKRVREAKEIDNGKCFEAKEKTK